MKTLKGTIQQDDLLIDDMGLMYRVVDVFNNSAVIENFPNPQCYGCEIMSFKSMADEGWKKLEMIPEFS